MPQSKMFAMLLLAVAVVAAGPAARAVETASGYRGVWYMNQPTGDEFKYKYSGGLGTYPQQHAPIAVYSREAHKTFFVYGGATGRPHELACMVSYFDHAAGTVPRPRVVLVKPTADAHENPTLQIDDEGRLWIFCNTHGPAESSHIFRSASAYSIDEFEEVARTNFSYSQPWAVAGRGFLFLHTRYHSGRRRLFWMTSRDGLRWSPPQALAGIAQGHYQISQRQGDKVGTAFNYHPPKGGLNARTNLYYLETSDMGAAWRTIDGQTPALPLEQPHNAALVHDYEAEGLLAYLKDLNFDAAGRPVILYLTAGGFAPGPDAGPRQWYTAHWTGERWRIRPFTVSDHNYDFGSLYIEENGQWRIIAPTEPGPQPQMTGGDMALWTSDDEGGSWTRRKQLTAQSRFNHTYARRPLDAHEDFYALWADGDPREPSDSRLYFTDRDGARTWRLPVQMAGDHARPEAISTTP
ncbi:MAG: BNR-4 repeat-containing protein [Pirellulales bacterium]|nr:BNR-4 repeat-containing protein [Pirellulales bacterium]